VSASASAVIHGRQGDLVSLRIGTDPRHLEDLLETLSRASFPINPQLWHRPSGVTVEFPAWQGDVEELRRLLAAAGFDSAAMSICPPLSTLD
jgi:hypothetical protein